MRKIVTILALVFTFGLTTAANAETPLYYKDTFITNAKITDGVSFIDIQEVCDNFNADYSYIPVADAVAIKSGANQILIYKNKVIMSNHESEVFMTTFDLIGSTNSGGSADPQIKVPLKPISLCFSNGDIMYDQRNDRILMESGKLYQEYLSRDNMIKVYATNYYGGPGIEGGPTTATGKTVEWGVIAIDPYYASDVMYLGAKVRLWNEDGTCLGEFSCEDTGGDIKGARIDIAHNSATEMQNFGNRYVYVEKI